MRIIFMVLLCLIPHCGMAQQLVTKISPISIVSVVRGHGRITAILSHERHFNLPTQTKYYQGLYKYRGQEYPVAASFNGKEYTLVFSGKKTGSALSRQRLFTIKVSSSGLGIKTSSIPGSFLKSAGCGTAHTHSHVNNKLGAQQALETYTVISVHAFYDAEWQALHGVGYIDAILFSVNMAEILYDKYLNIRFNIIGIDLFEETFPLDMGLYLGTFAAKTRQVSANVKHLFTAKKFASSVIGIAYIGALCYAPNYSAGITGSIGSMTGIVFAHEMGHTLSAQHDTNDSNSLMYPSIGWDASTKYLSELSITQIVNFLSIYNSCLKYENLPPNVQNATLSIVKQKRKIFIFLKSYRNSAISNENIFVKINKRKRYVRTDQNGMITQILRFPKKTRVTIIANVVQAPQISAFLRFKM